MEFFNWHPQIEDLIRRTAPDLIIGLLGVPVAFAFQKVSEGSIKLSCNVSSPDIWIPLILGFLYLACLYFIISYAFLDMIHHPRNWGSRLERWVRFLVLLPSMICIGLVGAYGDNLSVAKIFVRIAFFLITLALCPDFIRGGIVLRTKGVTSLGWVLVCALSLTWMVNIPPQ